MNNEMNNEYDFDLTGLDAYETNPEVEGTDGVWAKFPEGREFHILRAGGANKKFQRAHQAALKPYRRQIDKGTMDNDVLESIAMQTYARYVVIGWKGFNGRDGNEIPYSPEAAVAFWRRMPELFNELVMLSSEPATFHQLAVKEAQEVLGES